MTDKLNLKSSHEVIYTVNVADVESIFYCKPTDPDILTVLMKDGKRLYCDEVCPVDSLQEEPAPEKLKDIKKLADAMYYAAQYLTTDASRLHKAMDEYHQFIIHEWIEEPVSEDLEKASMEWLRPQLDVSYKAYGEGKQMELTHFDGYAMLDAIEFGAQWQKEQIEEIPPKFPLISQKKCMYTKDSYTDEDRKVLCDGCEEDCEYAQKKEPVSEDLESWDKFSHIDDAIEDYCRYDSHIVFFTESLNGEPLEEADDREQVESAFKAGAKWQKKQMMANAVEVEVKVDVGGYPYIPQMELYDYDKGVPLAKEDDKYKVILIKE